MSPLMEAVDVKVHFGGVRALDGASLTVEQGQLCGIIGPNGSGKSTLLSAVSRLVDLTDGSIRMEGRDYSTVAKHEINGLGLARTFQTVRLLPDMTVLSNVMIGAGRPIVRRSALGNWLRVDRARRDERVAETAAREALELVGMADYAQARPGDLPYGLQRRVEIGRALASKPKLLLLDEPTAGMNQAERRDIGDLMLGLQKSGLTQVLVEHDLSMIHRICSDAIALNFGQVIATGTPRAVADDPGVREAYLGREGVPSAPSSAVQEAP